jgi:hypothetical protein
MLKPAARKDDVVDAELTGDEDASTDHDEDH